MTSTKAIALREWMTRLGITEADLEEHFVRSSGSGGQNVNKVATCVVLKHRPSGIEIKCHQARTQGLNRYYARKRLCERIEAQQLGAQSREQQRIEKIRRQKRRRSRRAKEKMLQEKHKHAQKKSLRRPPRNGEM